MKDSLIVERLWNRDQSALSAVSEKYGRYCTAVALNVLGNEQSAEECVNDSLLELWEAIPPNRPDNLMSFIGKITQTTLLI